MTVAKRAMPNWKLQAGGLLVLGLLAGSLVAEDFGRPDGWVERALFSTAIENREPVDQLAVLPNTAHEIYFFTDLRQLQGRKVTHRWEYDGQVMSEVTFQIGGPRWRVFSRKSLDPAQIGKWTVIVVDESGWPLRAAILDYRAAQGADESRGRVELPPRVDETEQYAPPERPGP